MHRFRRTLLLTTTVSIGVSAWTEREALPEALQRADEALYRAKGGGRNRVEAESFDPGPVKPQALRAVVSRSR